MLKEVFISPALIYLPIYYKATLFKGNMGVYRGSAKVTELGYMELIHNSSWKLTIFFEWQP